jgi:hypothetical protein
VSNSYIPGSLLRQPKHRAPFIPRTDARSGDGGRHVDTEQVVLVGERPRVYAYPHPDTRRVQAGRQ